MKQYFGWLGDLLKIALGVFIVWVSVDQAIRILDLGDVLPDHYDKQNLQRQAAPYIEFKGAPGKLDHDRHGYRWVPEVVDPEALSIAFFGGSTGYNGQPPIALLVESLLNEQAGIKVQVANFSVVSSNHRQHLHNILESREIFNPDVVIFYGGYNETVQSGFYDPRPGYPYNYYYRNETSSLGKLLIRYSPTFYMVDKLLTEKGHGGLTPLAGLRKTERPFSADWNASVVQKYFDTVSLAHETTRAFQSRHCGKTGFLFFYQPYQVPKEFFDSHIAIRERLAGYSYGYDVSDVFSGSGPGIFTDVVHVKQQGREVIAKEITRILLGNDEFNECINADG